MNRAVLLLSCLFVAACTVGDLPGTGGGGNPGTDAGTTPGIDAPGAHSNGCVDRIVPPGGAHPHAGGGVTHAGEGCIVSGCHLNNTGGGPGFQFAGTVYKPGTTTPSTGVTVTVKSAGGQTAIGVTDDAGNFNIVAGTLPNPFPATVSVTACPTLTPMSSSLAQGGGNCTSAGCHGTALPVTL